MGHEMHTRRSSGWWSNLVEVVCSCGWRGPTRDMYQSGTRSALLRDEMQHERGDR